MANRAQQALAPSRFHKRFDTIVTRLSTNSRGQSEGEDGQERVARIIDDDTTEEAANHGFNRKDTQVERISNV